MAEVRFKLDHQQLTIACDVMAVFLMEHPIGETQNLLHSLVGRLHMRLAKRLPERRLEYGLNLMVHDALALRRMLLGGIEWVPGENHQRELRLILGIIDPLTTRYTIVTR